MFDNYNGSIKNLPKYLLYYKEEQLKKSLYERYVANSLGKIANAETSYDDLLKRLENMNSYKPKRTANEIKQDLIKKFNNGE